MRKGFVVWGLIPEVSEARFFQSRFPQRFEKRCNIVRF